MIERISHLWTNARLAALAKAAFVSVLLYSALPFATYGLRVLRFPYQVEYNEGRILDQVIRLSHFENIFTIPMPEGPYTVANYTPLFNVIQVPFMWVAGPALWYGRAISWIAAVAAALLIGATVHTLTKNYLAAVTSSLVFVSIPYVVACAPNDRGDCLALALTWAALFAVARWPESRLTLVAAAALFTASAFTRQTYLLAGPLAAFALLVKLGHRQRAFALGILTGSACVVIALALNLATGGGFYFDMVLCNLNPLRLELLTSTVQDIVEFMAPLVICTVALLVLEKSSQVRWFLLPYALGAVAVMLTIAKVGAGVNYLLELSAALSACVGYLVAAFRVRWAALRTVVAVAIVVQALLFGVWWREIMGPGLSVAMSSPSSLARLQTIVAEAEGPVLLEDDMAMAPLCGKRLVFHPFEMTQLENAGRWDQSVFVHSIESKQYSVIVTSQLHVFDRWTPEMRAAIARSYVPDQRFFGMVVYRPARAASD